MRFDLIPKHRAKLSELRGLLRPDQVAPQDADTCTAALSARVAELERQAAQLTAERDEWAHKAQDWRHKYAELRYPGMTREVKALDAAIDAAMKETASPAPAADGVLPSDGRKGGK